MTNSMWTVIKNAGDIANSKAVVGEQPTVLKTDKVSMLVDRRDPSKAGDSAIVDGNQSVVLPDGNTLLQGTGAKATYLDTKVPKYDDDS